MEETAGLHSNKKFWAPIIACVIGFALLLSALLRGGYPEGSLTHIVFKFSGLFLLAVGLSVLIVDLTRSEKFKMPVTTSVWLAVDRGEEIKLETEIDRARLDYIIRDLREYEKVNACMPFFITIPFGLERTESFHYLGRLGYRAQEPE